MTPGKNDKGVFIVIRLVGDNSDGVFVRELQKRCDLVARSEHLARINSAEQDRLIMGPVLFFDEENTL